MLSPSLEDYLEEVYRLQLNYNIIRVSDVAARLRVSLPSVVSALRKLHHQGYIDYGSYGKIQLTPQGKEKGKFLVDRNRTLKEFLSSLCCTCDIEAEAEAIEHYLSNSTIKLMGNLAEFLNSHPGIHEQFKKFCQDKHPTSPSLDPAD